MKRLSYFIAQKLYRKYHKHKRYWYYFYAQFAVFNLTELFVLFFMASLLDTTKQTALVLLGFFTVRSFNAKNHLNSYVKCIIVSTLSLIGLSLVSNVYTAFFDIWVSIGYSDR